MNSIYLEIKSIKTACNDIAEKVYDMDIPKYDRRDVKNIDKNYSLLDDQMDEVIDVCAALQGFADRLGEVYARVRELGAST